MSKKKNNPPSNNLPATTTMSSSTTSKTLSASAVAKAVLASKHLTANDNAQKLSKALLGAAEVERLLRGDNLNDWDAMTLNNYKYLIKSMDDNNQIPTISVWDKTIMDWLGGIFPTTPYTVAYMYKNELNGKDTITFQMSTRAFSSTAHNHHIYDTTDLENAHTNDVIYAPKGGFQQIVSDILKNPNLTNEQKALEFHYELFNHQHAYIHHTIFAEEMNGPALKDVLLNKARGYIKDKQATTPLTKSEFIELYNKYPETFKIFPVEQLANLYMTHDINIMACQDNYPHVELDAIEWLIETGQIIPSTKNNPNSTKVLMGLSRGNPHIVSSCGGCSTAINKYITEGFDINFHAWSTILPEKTYDYTEHTEFSDDELLELAENDETIKKILAFDDHNKYVKLSQKMHANTIHEHIDKVDLARLNDLYMFQQHIKHLQTSNKSKVNMLAAGHFAPAPTPTKLVDEKTALLESILKEQDKTKELPPSFKGSLAKLKKPNIDIDTFKENIKDALKDQKNGISQDLQKYYIDHIDKTITSTTQSASTTTSNATSIFSGIYKPNLNLGDAEREVIKKQLKKIPTPTNSAASVVEPENVDLATMAQKQLEDNHTNTLNKIAEDKAAITARTKLTPTLAKVVEKIIDAKEEIITDLVSPIDITSSEVEHLAARKFELDYTSYYNDGTPSKAKFAYSNEEWWPQVRAATDTTGTYTIEGEVAGGETFFTSSQSARWSKILELATEEVCHTTSELEKFTPDDLYQLTGAFFDPDHLDQTL